MHVYANHLQIGLARRPVQVGIDGVAVHVRHRAVFRYASLEEVCSSVQRGAGNKWELRGMNVGEVSDGGDVRVCVRTYRVFLVIYGTAA